MDRAEGISKEVFSKSLHPKRIPYRPIYLTYLYHVQWWLQHSYIMSICWGKNIPLLETEISIACWFGCVGEVREKKIERERLSSSEHQRGGGSHIQECVCVRPHVCARGLKCLLHAVFLTRQPSPRSLSFTFSLSTFPLTHALFPCYQSPSVPSRWVLDLHPSSALHFLLPLCFWCCINFAVFCHVYFQARRKGVVGELPEHRPGQSFFRPSAPSSSFPSSLFRHLSLAPFSPYELSHPPGVGSSALLWVTCIVCKTEKSEAWDWSDVTGITQWLLV